jgi:hypothetical protein
MAALRCPARQASRRGTSPKWFLEFGEGPREGRRRRLSSRVRSGAQGEEQRRCKAFPCEHMGASRSREGAEPIK